MQMAFPPYPLFFAFNKFCGFCTKVFQKPVKTAHKIEIVDEITGNNILESFTQECVRLKTISKF